MNILDYIKSENKSFDEKPFNAVDSLVLCQLSYAKLEVVVDGLHRDRINPGMTIKDFYKAEFFGNVFSDEITDEQNYSTLALASASPRFRDITVSQVVSEYDENEQMQFAALTFSLNPKEDYVAFRGTDGTLIGWKEDFNLAFMTEVPAQSRAVAYINKFYGTALKKGFKKKIYIGGHSKGGNLAVYSAVMSKREIKPRIIEVFSHDGPGFRDDIVDKINEIRDRENIKITKLVPQSSIIGMLLETQEKYSVVKSDAIGIMQHAAFSWQIDGDDFIYKDGITGSGMFMDKALHEWLMTADYDKREVFVNALYDVLIKNDIHTLHDLKGLTPRKIIAIIDTMKNLDDETKEIINMLIKSLVVNSLKALAPGKETADIEVEEGR